MSNNPDGKIPGELLRKLKMILDQSEQMKTYHINAGISNVIWFWMVLVKSIK